MGGAGIEAGDLKLVSGVTSKCQGNSFLALPLLANSRLWIPICHIKLAVAGRGKG